MSTSISRAIHTLIPSLRSATPSKASASGSPSKPEPVSGLPSHLLRLVKIQSTLQHVISHSLATSGVAPSTETGIVRNVLDHLTLNSRTGLDIRLDVDDIRRLCWLWEWDGKIKSKLTANKSILKSVDEENPFAAEDTVPVVNQDWSRGAMGFIISQTTHFDKSSQSRIPAYGIGIEIEMDLDKDEGGGMASVARWTAGGEKRRRDVLDKARKWVEASLHSDFYPVVCSLTLPQLHKHETVVPNIPMADLPQLITPAKPSNLTRLLASASPKSPSSLKILSTPPSPSHRLPRPPANYGRLWRMR